MKLFFMSFILSFVVVSEMSAKYCSRDADCPKGSRCLASRNTCN